MESRADIQAKWWVDAYIIDEAIDVINNAVAANPKTWEYYKDKKAKLQALKFLSEFSGRGKKTNIINVQIPFKRLSVNQLLNN